MSTTTYTVPGMTCDHCVRAVTTAVSAVAGVTDVAVNLPAGQVSVTSDRPVDDVAVRVAVEDAGYEVAAQ